MTYARRLTVACCLAVGLALTGCGNSGSDEQPSPGTESAGSESAAPSAPAESEAAPTDSMVDGVIEGFPTDLIPEFPGSKTTSTADTAEGDIRKLSLSGTTDKSAKDVVDFYAGKLEDAGFKKVSSTEEDKTATTVYSRSDGVELLTVTTAPHPDDDKMLVFTVGGEIKADK
ncbi:hypothetical protein LWF01_05840 [Saxibacter everestensis]|uniref:Uncharacterized protein n=1 Tax=Saxibacter everestensis TaxID=2909229 RepID=A0ABY8QWC7_9MICO|nr:hypothetical protein LWF01_05840 [Brevibacteriaceae bacterium ZFBP1038]